jgi:hypothetical protein
MRPKDSLDFTNFEGRAIFFGDETSMAAAYALQSCRRADARHQYVLEVTSVAEAKIVVDRLGLEDVTLYQRTSEGEHLDRVVKKLAQMCVGILKGLTIPTSLTSLRGEFRSGSLRGRRGRYREYRRG